MKLLLDTHVFVWAESLVERPGHDARGILLDPANTLLVSPVTTLELSRLISPMCQDSCPF
jgi:PIN domain nuclease of toxin-antitoxin system